MKLFSYHFIFKNLKNKEILIFDEGNFQYLLKLFPSQKTYFVYKIREIHFYINLKVFNYFIKSLFYFSWKDFFWGKSFRYTLRELLCYYHMACIKTINPEVIITFTDNSFYYNWLVKNYKDIKFLAIQNGNRTTQQLNKITKFNHQHFFCFGSYEVERYRKFGHQIRFSHPVGSLKSDYFRLLKKDTKVTKLYKIAFVSQFSISHVNGENVFPSSYKYSEKLMHSFISKYVNENKIKILILLRFSDSNNFLNEEIKYFKNIYKDAADLRVNKKENFSTYFGMSESDIILSFYSTSTIEAFGLGEKILHCDFTKTDLYNDYDSMIMFRETSYDKFKNRLDSLRAEPREVYIKRTKAYQKELMNNNLKDSTIKYIKKIISE